MNSAPYVHTRLFLSLHLTSDSWHPRIFHCRLHWLPKVSGDDVQKSAALADVSLSCFLSPATSEGNVPKPPPKTKKQGKGYYRVTVLDNGSGMPHKEIPRMFGKGQ